MPLEGRPLDLAANVALVASEPIASVLICQCAFEDHKAPAGCQAGGRVTRASSRTAFRGTSHSGEPSAASLPGPPASSVAIRSQHASRQCSSPSHSSCSFSTHVSHGSSITLNDVQLWHSGQRYSNSGGSSCGSAASGWQKRTGGRLGTRHSGSSSSRRCERIALQRSHRSH